VTEYHFKEKSLRYLVTANDLKIVRISRICLEQGLKGNLMPGRGVHVVFQAILLALLLISGSLVSLLTSIRQGPVLKAVIQRGN